MIKSRIEAIEIYSQLKPYIDQQNVKQVLTCKSNIDNGYIIEILLFNELPADMMSKLRVYCSLYDLYLLVGKRISIS